MRRASGKNEPLSISARLAFSADRRLSPSTENNNFPPARRPGCTSAISRLSARRNRYYMVYSGMKCGAYLDPNEDEYFNRWAEGKKRFAVLVINKPAMSRRTLGKVLQNTRKTPYLVSARSIIDCILLCNVRSSYARSFPTLKSFRLNLFGLFRYLVREFAVVFARDGIDRKHRSEIARSRLIFTRNARIASEVCRSLADNHLADGVDRIVLEQPPGRARRLQSATLTRARRKVLPCARPTVIKPAIEKFRTYIAGGN